MDEAEGLDKIEQLQNHPKDEIHEKAVKILEAYFGFEDEEDQNLAPQVSSDRERGVEWSACGALRLTLLSNL